MNAGGMTFACMGYFHKIHTRAKGSSMYLGGKGVSFLGFFCAGFSLKCIQMQKHLGTTAADRNVDRIQAEVSGS